MNTDYVILVMNGEIKLTPSPNGINCIGNGQHEVECQCDECDFFLDCFPELPDSADRNDSGLA